MQSHQLHVLLPPTPYVVQGIVAVVPPGMCFTNVANVATKDADVTAKKICHVGQNHECSW